MGRDTSKISARQLLWMLLVSRAVSLLSRPTLFGDDNNARLTLIGTLISVAVVYLLVKAPSLRRLSNVKPNTFTRLMLIAHFLLTAILSIVHFTVFFQIENEVVYPTIPTILLLAATALFALSSGLESAARVSAILAAIFGAIMGLTMVTNIGRMAMTNLMLWTPRAESTAIWNTVLGSTLLCPEIPLFCILKPYLRAEDSKKPVFLQFYTVQAVLIVLFTISQELVFGSFIGTISYPVYSLVVVGEFSIFQRLDILHVGLWTLLTLIKVTVLCIGVTSLLTAMKPSWSHKKLNVAVVAVLGAGVILLMSVLTVPAEVAEWILMALLTTAGLSVVPQLFRKKEEAEDNA